MTRYFAIVEKDEDSAFGVEFPDLPTVFSAADVEEDIIKNAMEALQLYFEDNGQTVPASSLKDLMARQDIKQKLAKGAFLVNVPLLENDTAVVRANLTFERGLLKAIDSEAKARGLSRSAFLANAARHEIGI